MALHRFAIFAVAESSLPLFYINKMGARARRNKRIAVEKYMRDTAPEKYPSLLIPDFDVGCKRRIFNDGYLESLHAPNLTLTDQMTLKIVPDGLETETGIIRADIIILANGFKTNEFLDPLQVHGRDGLSINYALRILAPVLKRKAASAEVKFDAEKQYVYHVRDELNKRVWSAGCKFWYIKPDNQWNSMSYPLFPVWNYWVYKAPARVQTSRAGRNLLVGFLAVMSILLSQKGITIGLRELQEKFTQLWRF
ncbi:hypothetical protein V8E51_015785 [Hyaloscypha variabilis]